MDRSVAAIWLLLVMLVLGMPAHAQPAQKPPGASGAAACKPGESSCECKCVDKWGLDTGGGHLCVAGCDGCEAGCKQTCGEQKSSFQSATCGGQTWERARSHGLPGGPMPR
jgi:hypothetical protein